MCKGSMPPNQRPDTQVFRLTLKDLYGITARATAACPNLPPNHKLAVNFNSVRQIAAENVQRHYEQVRRVAAGARTSIRGCQ